MKIYVASSWRNPYVDNVIEALSQRFGIPHVYNFKTATGFHYSKVLGDDWVNTPVDAYKASLDHPEVQRAYLADTVALETASATVMVLPAGRSAAWEFGFATAREQYTAIYSREQFEPELMFTGAKLITDNIDELVEELDRYESSIWNTPAPIRHRR